MTKKEIALIKKRHKGILKALAANEELKKIGEGEEIGILYSSYNPGGAALQLSKARDVRNIAKIFKVKEVKSELFNDEYFRYSVIIDGVMYLALDERGL